MSHLRRTMALIMLTLMGWLTAFGAASAASTALPAAPSGAQHDTYIICC